MDIRELRINTSVLFNDERVKITAIDFSEEEPFVLIDNKELWVSSWMHATMLKPIPITEELLKELGFEEEKEPEEEWDYGIEKVFMKDFINDDGVLDFVSLAQYEGGLYQLQVLGTLAYVRNLHELESYVYMTTKQEQI